MTWNAQFTKSLDGPSKTVEYALVFLPGGPNSVLFNGTLINNDPNQKVFLSEAYVTIDNVQVTPSRWSVNFGGFTIEIVGDIRPLKKTSFQKGALAELHMRRNGQHVERVAIGQLRNISGGRGKWRLQFGDLLSALASRFTSSKNTMTYYNNVGKTTKVNTNWNFSSSPNLYVDDVTIFAKETGGNGMIRVNRAGTIGYLLWDVAVVTSSPVGYLRIVDTDPYPDKNNVTVLNINDEVTYLALIVDRPDHIFAKTIMSTGGGTQGSFDKYPEAWGSGFKFNPNIIDALNMEFIHNAWQAPSGDYEFQLVIDQEEASGIRFLLDKCLAVGMWPVFRQNAISWRACQNPNTASLNTLTLAIHDSDIIAVNSHDIYSPSQSASYTTSKINCTDASHNEIFSSADQNVIRSLPVNSEIARKMSLIYKIDNPTQLVKAAADVMRLKYWDFYPWEELVITVRERFAVLVAGDIIEITSNELYGYAEAEGKTYQSRRGMILGVRWQPNQSQCILRIGIITN
jgi:hypothetical protein